MNLTKEQNVLNQTMNYCLHLMKFLRSSKTTLPTTALTSSNNHASAGYISTILFPLLTHRTGYFCTLVLIYTRIQFGY